MFDKWPAIKLGNKEYFEILGSGIDFFNGEKYYLSTSSIDGNKIVKIEGKVAYYNRPSRANMQPRLNSVWFARMMNTIKVYCFTEENKAEVDKYILSTGFAGILCNPQKVLPKYLEKIFLSKWFNSIKDALASDKAIQKSLNNDDIENIEIPLPPLHIQQKIVSILDTIQSAIEVQERIIEKTKELKKAMMNLLFHYGVKALKVKELLSSQPGELTSSDVEKLGIRLKKTEIGEIPEDWEVVKLGEICSLKNGERPIFSDGGRIPIYGANGITGYSNKFLIDSDYTLIIGRVGASGEVHLGKGKLWVSDNAIYSEKYDQSKLSLIFAYYLLIFKNLAQFTERTTHPIITQSFLKNLKLPLPPLPEQQEIAEILQTIDQKIEIEQKKKELYEELFKTMLNKLMSGEIDVEKIKINSNHDRNDSPK